MKQKQINLPGRQVLAILARANGRLSLFAAYRRSKIPFTAFSETVNRLKKNKLVEEKSQFSLSLTESGRAYVASIRAHRLGYKPWREVPDKMKRAPLSPHQLYVPNKKRFFDGFIENND